MISAEQIALKVADVQETIEAYKRQGYDTWVQDTVTAQGYVKGKYGTNVAHLAFNYAIIIGKELELISYESGPNWLSERPLGLSHMGMHVDQKQMDQFRVDVDWPIAQEVWTVNHTSEHLRESGKRYHYVIFDSRDSIGFDLKLIRRIEP